MSDTPISIVLLHGHGGSPATYEDVAVGLGAEVGCPVLVPAGPVLLEGGRAWWDHPDEGPGAEAHAIVAEAIGSAGGAVVVVGFSQGASMAAAVAGLGAVAAVVMVAGFLPEPRPEDPVTAPVLTVFGEADEIVDPFLSQMASRAMARRGADVEEVGHGGGHLWTDEVTTIVSRWITENVGNRS